MADNTPPTQPDNSRNSTKNPYSGHMDSQKAVFAPSYSSVLPYGNYSSWNNLWSSNYSGYATMAPNPALHANMPPYGIGHIPQKPPNAPCHHSKIAQKVDVETSSSKTTAPARVNTPPLPDPDTYRHWDDVLKTFLEKTNLTQCRKGFEIDILVLNAEWEQKVLPEALKDLVYGMQVILDRISGKAKVDPEIQADANKNTSLFEPTLDERKLDYIQLSKNPVSQSSITKSISQFLARSRARNDHSNRAEFLQTLAEKKQPVDSDSMTDGQEISSCARVDAKTIDRAKQIKYDIMKNEDGPLTRTASNKTAPSGPVQDLPESAIVSSSSSSITPQPSLPALHFRKKRRLADVEDSATTATGEREGISSALIRAIDERMRNVEEHLSVRYVPSPPQTFLTRLKYLEDYLIRLEKEYPPWAALHFKQPNRGWPPPPRSTPIIVPPHLRSRNGKQPTNNAHSMQPPSSIQEVTGQPPAGTIKRHKNSTLHKAVMDRLEIQQAMNEMGLQRGV